MLTLAPLHVGIGFFERANGGLLFLDEIGNMPLTTQAKLLRVLQDGTFRRIGSSEGELKADFQLVCATNVAPSELLAQGRLREDFYDRIAALTVHTPPLRECREDISKLAAHFLRQQGLAWRKHFLTDVLDIFARFDWPGNVRQLQRVIQEAVVRSEDTEEIRPEHLPSFLSPLRERAADAAAVGSAVCLPEDPKDWPRTRLLSEIRLAIEAKRHIQSYKRKQWKAEFMRLMYPHYKAASAKGFGDLIRRLKGPWGEPRVTGDEEFARLLAELQS